MADGDRKLTVILSADAVGYSRLMEDDERATVRTLTEHRAVFRQFIEAHKGRIVDAPGDNLMAEFASPVEAVVAATEIQRRLADRNDELPDSRRMDFRIGINLGDVIEQDGALFGDGVNIAARLEKLAEAGGICLSGPVFDQVKGKLDYGFDYFGEQQVKNISEPIRAYRVMLEGGAAGTTPATRGWLRPGLAAAAALVVVGLVAAVWLRVEDGLRQAETVGETAPDVGMPSGPVIAVLPFKNMTGDADHEYFSDGITEDIIMGLLKFHEFRIAASDTTFRFKDTDAGLPEIGRELGADFIVEGTVRRTPDMLRVTAKLLDTKSATHVWGETYERALTPENIFAVQDEIAGQVIATIADSWGVVSMARLQTIRAQPPESLESYDCLTRVYDFYRTMREDAHFDVRACLEATVERDPNFADAFGWLANIYNEEYAAGLNPRPDPLDRALRAATRAVELDPRGFIPHAGLADVLFYRGDREAFLATAEKAYALNPNHAMRIAVIGTQMAQFGYWERGLELIDRGIALNPDGPSWVYVGAVLDHMRKGEFDQAVVAAEQMALPDWLYAVMLRASAYGHVGDGARAQANIQQILALDPAFPEHPREVMEKHNVDAALIDVVMDGLRKGGLDISAAATN